MLGCHYIVTRHLKGRIVEPEEMVIARQCYGKHVPVATDTHTAIQELQGAVFSMHFVPRLCNNDQYGKLVMSCELVASEQSQLVVGHEHVSRRISVVGSHYIATTAEDITN
jgi:hypothetical protein